jgi:predicted TIM-barrel fold metal-dependent hydrolase
MRVASDVHTHVWAPEHVSDEFLADLVRAWPEARDIDAGYEAHAVHAADAGRSVVVAFDAPYTGFVVPDDFVAAYVRRDPRRLIGFCSIDAARPDALERLARATDELGLRGLKIAPTYQGFDPLSSAAFRLYEAAAARSLPILWHQGVTFVRKSIMAYALPRQIDDVAIRIPELRIVIAHIGHPWIDECLAVVRKHPNVFADISALTPRPTQLRSALIAAAEYRCGEKLLFGTDWPFGSIHEHMEVLARWARDEGEPETLRGVARKILEVDSIAALGL